MGNNYYFSKKDTAIFKGIAILMIVLHNYLHFQEGFFLENEAVFKPNNAKDFMKYLIPLRWYESFSAIAGFLGHYGVQLFIFFSAYGLSIQMMKKTDSNSYLQYLLPRLKKLYFLLFFGIIVFLFINFFTYGKFYGFSRTLKETVMLVTSATNVRNSTLYSSFSGPFWFFGLMVQLYLVFPFLFRLVRKVNIYLLLAITLFIISALYFVDRKTDFSVFGTVVGHLPESILGIYFAQKGITKPNIFFFIGSVALFIGSQIYGTLFPFSFLAITLILLYVIGFLKPFINDFFTKCLIYIGEISMILFVVNGPFRFLPFFQDLKPELRAERVFLYLILLFILSHILYIVYKKIATFLKI